jgi:tRNA dimethylallyltransferase
VLELDARETDRRIDRRSRAMFDGGIVEEAAALWKRCPGAPALTGLGFAEALAWRRGEATRHEALRAMILRTQRYAKRQRTWFRRLRDAVRIDAADPQRAAASIVRLARESLAAT